MSGILSRSIWLRTTGRALAFGWALAWAVYGFTAGLGLGWDLLTISLTMALPGLVFLAVTAVAWGWPRAGGMLLLLLGAGLPLISPLLRGLGTLLLMALPPALAGLLLLGYSLLESRERKRRESVQTRAAIGEGT